MARHVRFANGERLEFSLYSAMMLGKLSPTEVAVRMRQSPAGALDAALPRKSGGDWRPGARNGMGRARDQDPNGGKLDGSYCRATDAYLRAHDVDEEDVAAVMKILGKYQNGEDEEPMIPVGGLRGSIGNPYPSGRLDNGSPAPGGAQDAAVRAAEEALRAHQRTMAVDAKIAQSDRERRSFAARWPELQRIRVL